MLRAAGTIRTIGVCLALLAASYLASALANASPVSQPALTGPHSRGRVIVLAPAQPQSPAPAATPFEVPAAGPEPALAPAAPPTRRL